MYLNGHGIHVILYRWPMAMAHRSCDIDSHYMYIYMLFYIDGHCIQIILYRWSWYTGHTI